MKVNYKTLTGFLLLLSFQTIFAGTYPEKLKSLSVEKAVEIALQYHTDIIQQKIKLDLYEKNKKHSWNKFLPSIDITAGIEDNNTDVLTQGNNAFTVSAGLQASLGISLGAGYEIKELKEKYAKGLIDYERTVKEIERVVRRDYYYLMYLKEKVAVCKTSVEANKSQLEQTRIKKNRGVIPEVDYLSAQVKLKKAELDYEHAYNDWGKAGYDFADAIGIDLSLYEQDNTTEGDSYIDQEGSLEFANTSKQINYSLLNTVISNSLEIKAIEKSISIVKAQKISRQLEYFAPAIKLSAGYNPFYNVTTAASNSNLMPFSASAGIVFPLGNVIPGSKAYDAVNEYDCQLKILEEQLSHAKRTVRSKTLKQMATVISCQKQLEAIKDYVNLSARQYDQTLIGYRYGVKDLTSLQNALTALNEAKLSYRLEQFTLIENMLLLEQSLNVSYNEYFEDTPESAAVKEEEQTAQENEKRKAELQEAEKAHKQTTGE